jgi:hypothetical protein
MDRRRIVVSFRDIAEVERERDGLRRGGVMARGLGGIAPGTDCEVELVHPSGRRIAVIAQAVWGSPDGTAFAFREVTADGRAALEAWLGDAASSGVPVARGSLDGSGDSGDSGDAADAGEASDSGDSPDAGDAGNSPDAADADESDYPDISTEESPGDRTTAEPRAERSRPGQRAPLNAHERLRGLSVVEQQRVAREGEVSERIVLERLYGKVIWETLLRNPRLTIPEVTHLARMGSLPRPLLELIVSNVAWLQAGQVRRALLGNTRLSIDMVERVLRAMPRNDLRLVATQTIYAAPIRSLARRMMGL